jgi:TP901 family phage tail tape measure protein
MPSITQMFEIRVKDYLNKSLMQAANLADTVGHKLDKLAQKKLSGLDKTFSGLGKGLRNTLPDLGLPSFGNIAGGGKMGVAVAGASTIAAALVLATNRAKEFEYSFLDLQQLNLDKSNAQIDVLRRNVYDTAKSVGADASSISRSFFDVQSSTGGYGKSVADQVTKIGLFAKVMKSDLNETVLGSAKAMKAFGLEASQTDDYLKVLFKTAQTSALDINQISGVQADFSGYAKVAGQDVNSTGKLFSALTYTTKSAEEAATLTKSAFQDLLKEGSIKGFHSMGIDVYANNKVKKIDEIMEELIAKFEPLKGNDRAINERINNFKGANEGLVKVLQIAANQAIDTKIAFQQYESTHAKNNLHVTIGELKNNFNTSLSELGEHILPAAIAGVKGLNWGLKQTEGTYSLLHQDFLSVKKDNNQRIKEIFGENVMLEDKVLPMTSGKVVDYIAQNGQYYTEATTTKDKVRVLDDMVKVLGSKDYRMGGSEYFQEALQRKKQTDLFAANITTPTKLSDIPTIKARSNALGGASSIKEKLQDTSSGSSVRTVVVHIHKMVGIETNVTHQGDAGLRDLSSKIRQAINQEMIKGVRDSEIALAH